MLELFVTLLLFPEVYQVWTTKHVGRQILVALYCLSFTFYQGSFMEETPSYGIEFRERARIRICDRRPLDMCF